MFRTYPAGDGGITVELGSAIDFLTSRRAFHLFKRLRASPPLGFIAALPTFCSLTVQFDPLVTDGEAIGAAVFAMAAEAADAIEEPSVRWRIPVCYDLTFAPDLEAIAAQIGKQPEAVAEIHAAQLYRVYMLGGFPGFAFMGDLPEALQAPRLASPRLTVPAGSVAVAGRLTAIYPAATPGGWNLIGRTPVRLFDPAWEQPALMSPGDEVAFYSVERAGFQSLEKRVAAGHVEPAEFRIR